ncbi:hypothetical protein ACP70R_029681 [Stipagrostis hirtigluma subsp. patula]
MACIINTSTALLLPLLASLLLAAGARAVAGEFPPLMVRRAGGLAPPPPASHGPVRPGTPIGPEDECPLIPVPSVVNACRSPPGLAVCVSQCKIAGHQGGHCDVLPSGLLGDCTCLDCLGSSQASAGATPSIVPVSAAGSELASGGKMN